MLLRNVCCIPVLMLGLISIQNATAEEDSSYLSIIEKRAAQAESEGNVQAMIECAYALYPIEFGKDAKEPRHVALISSAADKSIESKDAKKARGFLELAGPLAKSLSAEQQSALEDLATGRSAEQREQAEKQLAVDASRPVKKHAKELTDPDTKLKGSSEREFCDSVCRAALMFARPSAGITMTPRMESHSVSTKYGEIHASAHFYWKGWFTESPYDSDVTVVFSVSPVRCIRVDYSDDCPTPCSNCKKWYKFIRELNNAID